MVALGAGAAIAADPLVGTWKPNPDKCKISPGSSGARLRRIVRFEMVGENHYRMFLYTLDGKPASDAKGNATPLSELLLDAQDHRISDGNARTCRRIAEGRFTCSETGKAGTTVSETWVSADGRGAQRNRQRCWNRKRPSARRRLYVYDRE